MKIVDLMQLFRAQTYPATMLCLIAPFLFAVEFNAVALAFIVACIPLHYFTFGHNSVMDYWFDLGDPNKQHHPLVKSRIMLFDAHNIIHTGMMLTFIMFISLTILYARNVVMALAFLCAYIVFGHAYNDGMGKSTIFSFVPISLCFTALAGYGWFMSHETLDYLGTLILLYTFFNIFFQIAWEGNLKDIESDERNLLRALGVQETSVLFTAYIKVPAKAKAFAYSIRVALLMLIIELSIKTGNYIGLIIYILSFYPVHKITSSLILWEKALKGRDNALKYMSYTEICTIYGLLFTIVKIEYAIALGLYGLIYWYVINKILWGSTGYPRV